MSGNSKEADSPKVNLVGLPPSVQVHSILGCWLLFASLCNSLCLFFLIHRTICKSENDPLKLVNVFHSFPLTSHSCDRRCPSGAGTAPLPRGRSHGGPDQVWAQLLFVLTSLSPGATPGWNLATKLLTKDWRSLRLMLSI